MRTTKILLAFGILLLITGCVRSLHPLFTEKDLVFEPALVGTWAEEKGNDTWTFKQLGSNAYKLICKEKGIPVEFDAHLVRLGKFTFLDIYPEEPNIKNDFYKVHLIRAHTLSRIWIDKDVLHLAMLDNDWLKNMIDQGKANIGHERLDDTIVLTASTKDLQEFVLKYAEDTEAFSDLATLYRQQ